MESVRGFSWVKGLVLAMGMLGCSVTPGHGRELANDRFTLHYEVPRKEPVPGIQLAGTAPAGS